MPGTAAPSPSELIDRRIAELGDWRGDVLARVRTLIRQAVPDVVEEWKWRGVPVWEHDGIICTGESYKDIVKLTFAKGASLDDPAKLFNASLDGNVRRAIDIRKGEKLDAKAFKSLVKAAAALNESTTRTPRAKQAKAATTTAKKAAAKQAPGKQTTAKKTTAKQAPTKTTTAKKAPVLLAGGNPQVAKGHGDGPVQEYIAAMPGWKHDIARRVDEIVTRVVPEVHKAVKWNSPFYGVDGRGWFATVHALTRAVKVTFFQGASLTPEPPGKGKDPDARWIDIHEDDLDDAQLAAWFEQAAARPGWITADIA